MSNDTTNKGVKEASGKPVELVLKPGTSFTANGVKYTVSDSFTIGRMERVNLMEEELTMFSNRGDCHKVMIEAMNLMNNMKQGDAYALLYNKVNSDRENARLSHFTLRMCTAYINYEGEDLKYLTEEQITKKINDWSEEGLDVRPFIYFGMSVYGVLFQSYKKDILNILTEARSVKQSLELETDISNLMSQNEAGEAG